MYTGSALPVGWARIPLFQRDLRQGDNTGRDSVASIDIHWLLQNGDFKFTLHPGDVPELSTHPSSPTVPTQSEGKFILMTIDISLVHFFYNRTNFAVILCYGAVVSHL